MPKRALAGLCFASAMVMAGACSTEATSAAQDDGGSDETAATGAAEPATGPIVLDEILAFDDPASCDSGDTYDRLFSEMVVYENGTARAGEVSVPGIAAPVTAEVEISEGDDGEDNVEAMLPLEGTWLGLPVTGLTLSAQLDEHEYPIRGAVFDAPFDDVVRAVSEAGFNINVEAGEFDAPGYRSSARTFDDGRYMDVMVADAGDGYGVYFTCRIF